MQPTTITVSDTTLFHVAASWLGDATQWDRVASLNGLDDPIIVGVVQLLLPAKNPVVSATTANAP